MTKSLINTYKPIKGSDVLFPSTQEVIGKCPRCGNDVTENKKGFCCLNKTCGFALWKDNKFFTAKKKKLTKAIAIELLKNGKANLKGCYSEKTGKTYMKIKAVIMPYKERMHIRFVSISLKNC